MENENKFKFRPNPLRGVKVATPWATRIRRPTIWLVTQNPGQSAKPITRVSAKKVVVNDNNDLSSRLAI